MKVLRQGRISDIALTSLLIVLALTSLLSIGRMATKMLGPDGGLDFHSYWYAGHFVRQGRDPYQAYLTGAAPDTPVVYIDGLKSETDVAQPGLPKTPANTAPYVLPLSLLAFFSWQKAKIIWIAFNFLLLLTIPWLVVKLLPDDKPPAIPVAFHCSTRLKIKFWGKMFTKTIFISVEERELLTSRYRFSINGLSP